jgi:hypothetical protein
MAFETRLQEQPGSKNTTEPSKSKEDCDSLQFQEGYWDYLRVVPLYKNLDDHIVEPMVSWVTILGNRGG